MWRDRCVQTFLISIILLLIVGVSKSNTSKQSNEERFWALKTFAKPEFDMVIMGDSRTFCGVSPDAMNTILPDYRILNFGYSLGGLNSTMYSEASSKLDPRSEKKGIVLGVTPSSLTEETTDNAAFLEKRAMSREYVYLLTNLYPVMDLFSPLKPDEMLPLKLKNMLRRFFKKENTERHYREFHDNGWSATWRVPENPTKYLKAFRDRFLEYKVSANLAQGLMKQTMKWVEQGVHVYAFRVPSSKEMETLENELSGFDERSFSSKFEAVGGIWFSFPVEEYHSHDASHLEKSSAIQLSTDLATCIKMKTHVYGQ